MKNKFVILFLAGIAFSYSLKAQCVDEKKDDIFEISNLVLNIWQFSIADLTNNLSICEFNNLKSI